MPAGVELAKTGDQISNIGVVMQLGAMAVDKDASGFLKKATIEGIPFWDLLS